MGKNKLSKHGFWGWKSIVKNFGINRWRSLGAVANRDYSNLINLEERRGG